MRREGSLDSVIWWRCLDSGYILKVELIGFTDELDAGV